MAKISVIVPVYKVEPYLRRCVDSILVQTYRDFELILIDDGSPDKCGSICDEYAAKDSRVHVIHQQNGGLSAARNAGIDWAFVNSDSGYFTFIDSDDWVAIDYLQELLNGCALSGGVACVTCNEVTDGGESHWQECPREWHLISPQDYWLMPVFPNTVWGKLYPKSCFQNIRYPVGRIHEDEYVTHRLLFQCEKIAKTDASLYSYFRHGDSITGCGWNERTVDRIDGYIDQIRFFNDIGEPDLARRSERFLAENYAEAILHGHAEYRKLLVDLFSGVYGGVLADRKIYVAAYPIWGAIMYHLAHSVDFLRRRGITGALRWLIKRVRGSV